MSPTSYQAAPPRECIIAKAIGFVKLRHVAGWYRLVSKFFRNVLFLLLSFPFFFFRRSGPPRSPAAPEGRSV